MKSYLIILNKVEAKRQEDEPVGCPQHPLLVKACHKAGNKEIEMLEDKIVLSGSSSTLKSSIVRRHLKLTMRAMVRIAVEFATEHISVTLSFSTCQFLAALAALHLTSVSQ